jgi:membrane associated rhomboid family serine protease
MPGQLSVTIGASGAVFGILFAFGWLFPDEKIFLYFIVPMRARTFVLLYAVVELFAGFAHVAGDNVAHFAHLGGLLFGWLILLYWKNGGKGIHLFEDVRERSDREKGSRDFSGYHYHSSLDDDK